MELVEVSKLVREDGHMKTYASVGGYDLTFLDTYGNVICDDCATDVHEGNNEWLTIDEVEGAFVHWEGSPLTCNECGAQIVSEYGEIN
jgi:RNase P subunit RPR2